MVAEEKTSNPNEELNQKGTKVARFILKLTEWSGASRGDFEIVKGKFDIIEGEIRDNLAGMETDYLIIPETRYGEILFRIKEFYKGEPIEREVRYIFSYKSGWFKIESREDETLTEEDETLTEEDLKKIIEELTEQESKYVLRIKFDYDKYKGRSIERAYYEVFCGKVKELQLRSYEDNGIIFYEDILIPITNGVTLISFNGNGEPYELYLFRPEYGWKNLILPKNIFFTT